MLVKEPEYRLQGVDVLMHNFFANIDWDLMREGKVTPPFLPEKKNTLDTANFFSDYTEQKPVLSLVQMDQEMIKQCDTFLADFSFYPQQ